MLAADDPRHGTANGYSNLRCRCRRCKRAWAEHISKWRKRNGAARTRRAKYRLARLAGYSGVESNRRSHWADPLRREAELKANPAVGRHAITKVLRVHSGEEFTADEWPTLEEGQAAWAEWQRIQRNRPTPTEVEAAFGKGGER